MYPINVQPSEKLPKSKEHKATRQPEQLSSQQQQQEEVPQTLASSTTAEDSLRTHSSPSVVATSTTTKIGTKPPTNLPPNAVSVSHVLNTTTSKNM